MTLTYLDASAAMKLIIAEAESSALRQELTDSSRHLTASWLLHTELHCVAGRNPALIPIDLITAVLDVVTLVDPTRGDLLSAGTHAPLCSSDAIHLATALRIGAEEIITYDHALASAASRAGIRVVAPA